MNAGPHPVDETRVEIDLTTLRAAQGGDRRAMAQLVQRYERPVFALCSRMLLGRADQVPDVAQDVFLKVIRALERFDPDGRAALSTWILTIATRTCLDVLKRPYRHFVELEEDNISAGSDPERTAGELELERRVVAAMRGLSDPQRAVLILRAYHDLGYDEIARALGLTVGTVKSRLSRARDALRGAMEEPDG